MVDHASDATEAIVFALAANKCDMAAHQQVSLEHGMEFAKSEMTDEESGEVIF